MKEKMLYVITIIAILIVGIFYCYQYGKNFSDEPTFYMPKNTGESVEFTGNNQKIFTEVGHHMQKRLVSNGNVGTLVFGPYIDVDAGVYNIVFVYNVLDKEQISNANVDIISNNNSKVIIKKELDLSKNEIRLDNIKFNNDKNVEFRMFVGDSTIISFDKIIISKIR